MKRNWLCSKVAYYAISNNIELKKSDWQGIKQMKCKFPNFTGQHWPIIVNLLHILRFCEFICDFRQIRIAPQNKLSLICE